MEEEAETCTSLILRVMNRNGVHEEDETDEKRHIIQDEATAEVRKRMRVNAMR